MPKPIPIWLREYTMDFSDIQVTLTATAPMERGKIGTLTATAKHSCYLSTPMTYEIWAIEYGLEGFESSRFNRRIILGNTGTSEALEGFTNARPCTEEACPGKKVSRYQSLTHNPGRTMWCMKCWTDDMYESGMGGVGVPPFVVYHAFTPANFVVRLPQCNTCHSKFVVYAPGVLPKGYTSLFLPIQRNVLDKAVEDALTAKGIVGTIQRERSLNYTISDDQRQEILASALKPERIERIAEQTGLAPWDVLDNM
jgi:hypothetical protein